MYGMADSTPETFHGLLAQKRTALGMTQADVARAMGVTQAAVSLWESPAGPLPRYSKLRAISEVYEISYLRLRKLWQDASDDGEVAA